MSEVEVDTFSKIWTDDLLDRRREGEYLLAFLLGRSRLRAKGGTKRSYVLNVDAEWGQGKSFFMLRFREHIAAGGFPAVYIDTWQDDFTNEPFTAVMGAIDDFVQPYLKGKKPEAGRLRSAYVKTKRNFGRLAITLATGAAKKGAGKVFGDAVEDVVALYGEEPSSDEKTSADKKKEEKGVVEEILTDVEASVTKEFDALLDKFAEGQIKRFQEAKESLGSFRENLSAFLQQLEAAQEGSMQLPFFILVDELDRCRPTYAIEMLERIKHLFDVPNVVFVLSTNTEQLGHSIKAVYGQDFDSAAYLNRFFNRTYELPTPPRFKVVDFLWKTSELDESAISWPSGSVGVKRFIVDVSVRFNLSLRQLETLMEIFSALTLTWADDDARVDPVVLLPMVAVYVKNKRSLDGIDRDDHGLRAALKGMGDWVIDLAKAASSDGRPRQPMRVSQYIAGRLNNTDKNLADIYHDWLTEQSRGSYVGDNNDYPAVEAERRLRGVLNEEIHLLQQKGLGLERRSSVARYAELIKRAGRLSDTTEQSQGAHAAR